MKHRLTATAMAATTLGLAACGGGGGGGPGATASARSDVSASNYTTLAAPTARAVLSADQSGLLVMASAAGTADRAGALSAARRTSAAAPLPWLMRKVATGWSARVRPLQETTDTFACDNNGGTYTITQNDADNNGRLSRGDSGSVIFLNCVIDAELPPLDGQFDVRFHAVTLNGEQEPTALDAGVIFKLFSLGDLGVWNGEARVSEVQESSTRTRFAVTFKALSVLAASESVSYDFGVEGTLTDSTTTLSVQEGLIRLGGEDYVISSEVLTFVGNAEAPSSGSVTLKDAAGDALKLTARSATTVDLEYYPNGAATPTARLPGQTWASLRQSGD